MLMGLGALAPAGVAAPSNLAICVIDNQHYGETGMQETHTGHGVDLPAMASAAGFAETVTALKICIQLTKMVACSVRWSVRSDKKPDASFAAVGSSAAVISVVVALLLFFILNTRTKMTTARRLWKKRKMPTARCMLGGLHGLHRPSEPRTKPGFLHSVQSGPWYPSPHWWSDQGSVMFAFAVVFAEKL